MVTHDCEKIAEMLPDYVAGRTDPRDTEAICEHISACERCREECDAVRRDMDALRECACSEVPPELYTGVMSEIGRMSAQRSRGTWHYTLMRYGSLAAALLIILVCSALIMPRMLTVKESDRLTLSGNAAGDADNMMGGSFDNMNGSFFPAPESPMGDGVHGNGSVPECGDSAPGGSLDDKEETDSLPSVSLPEPPTDVSPDPLPEDAAPELSQSRVRYVYRVHRSNTDAIGEPLYRSDDGRVLFYIYSVETQGLCALHAESVDSSEYDAMLGEADRILQEYPGYSEHTYIAVYPAQ